jgi:hypothetical protein
VNDDWGCSERGELWRLNRVIGFPVFMVGHALHREGTCRLRGAASWLDVRVEFAPVLSRTLLVLLELGNNRVQDRF